MDVTTNESYVGGISRIYIAFKRYLQVDSTGFGKHLKLENNRATLSQAGEKNPYTADSGSRRLL